MFKFKESSWFIQYWVYLHTQLGMGYIPVKTNLCSMFWRTVLVTPIFVLGLIVLGPPILLIAGVIWCIYRFFKWSVSFLPRNMGVVDKVEDGCDVVVEFFVARKKKYCPLIEITEE